MIFFLTFLFKFSCQPESWLSVPGRVLDTGHAQRWPCLPSEEEATDKPSSASHQRPAAPDTAAQAPYRGAARANVDV